MAVTVSVRRKRISTPLIKGGGGSGGSTGGFSIHREFNTLYGGTDITDRSVSITFTNPFQIYPIGDVRCWRMVPQNGVWIRQNVLFTHAIENWLDTDHFELEIDPNESLTGVILQYLFQE
jgi:hypothetical protein